jgi:hypothetical protein
MTDTFYTSPYFGLGWKTLFQIKSDIHMDLVRQFQSHADSENTLEGYARLMRQLQRFFGANGRVVFAELGQEVPEIIPVNAEELMMFCETCKRANKPDMKAGSLESFRSAVAKFRTINGLPKFTEREEKELSRYFKGVKNELSAKIREGSAKPDEGKRHLQWAEYQQLCRKALNTSSVANRSLSELHLGITMSWNLTARGDTVSSIHSKHLYWEGDSLKLGIAKSKRNNSEVSNYYNVYANPLMPEVCPILSLAVHLACYPDILSL